MINESIEKDMFIRYHTGIVALIQVQPYASRKIPILKTGRNISESKYCTALEAARFLDRMNNRDQV